MLSSNTSRLAAAAGLASGLLIASNAAAVPIDLNDFFFDPLTPVAVSADGSAATFAEDASFGVVYLSNVPGFGDPTVITGGAGVSLAFDYVYDEPVDNDDIFHVALLDGLTGNPIGALFETFLSGTGSGTTTFDLSSFGSASLGLQFELVAGLADVALSSTLTISNLQLLLPAPPPSSVPEPPTLLLLPLAALFLRFRVFGSKLREKNKT